MSRDSGTRSGLLWEVERILKECENLPQFLLMENVPMVHGADNSKDFAEWISFLDSLGYRSRWQDLNAKDYGVAQNRVRCFMVSWLDKSFIYDFPEPIELTKTMQDFLEDTVDEKYYLKGDKVDELIEQLVELGIEREREYRLVNSSSICDECLDDNGSSRRGNQESSARSVGSPRKVGGYMNYNRVEEINLEVAKTICTDCKSFGTGHTCRNGVIEKWN